jgi:periplasmic divalent cation tolerance protein
MEVNMSPIVVLVTTSSAEEAQTIGKMVVSSGLAACANVAEGIQSIFRWNDNMNEENECLIILKSTLDRFLELETAIRKNHSYSVPEIIALPIIAGSAPYLEWIKTETHK